MTEKLRKEMTAIYMKGKERKGKERKGERDWNTVDEYRDKDNCKNNVEGEEEAKKERVK